MYKNKITSTKLLYTFKSDILFKMFFIKYPHLLKRLIAVLLSIPLESIEHFQTINTEIPPEQIDKKFCRLDVNMIVNDQIINLEIQIENLGNHINRCMFHWAKLFATALPSGKDYALLPKITVISIVNFKLFDNKNVHNKFGVMDIDHHDILSDKQCYHFFELPKMPNIDSIDTTNEKDLWLALFNAQTKEELEKLKVVGGEVMVQAVEAYKEITATQEFQYLELLREKTRRDEAQAISNAKQLGEQLGEQRADKKWQGVIAEKDTTLAQKDIMIAELLAKLEKLS